jgi:hypothetical protein
MVLAIFFGALAMHTYVNFATIQTHLTYVKGKSMSMNTLLFFFGTIIVIAGGIYGILAIAKRSRRDR